MKIKAKTAIKKIEAGSAWVAGKIRHEGEHWWVLYTLGMKTHHVRMSEAPELDKV